MELGHRKIMILAGIKWFDFSELRTKIKLILFRVATRRLAEAMTSSMFGRGEN
jgi:hypothetical protein